MTVNRVAVLYSRLSGYILSCLKMLQSKYYIDVLVYHWPVSENAPFHQEIFQDLINIRVKNNIDAGVLIKELGKFTPDTILMSGWMDKEYLKVARHYKKQGLPIVALSDTQWNGSWRQKVAGLFSKWYLHPKIDVIWGAGERQKQLSHKLGFKGERYWPGVYSCDWESFAYDPNSNGIERDYTFLYVGRYIDRKGIGTLVQAYKAYAYHSENPWKLICAGTGPDKQILEGVDGIKDLEFIQPDELPLLMKNSGAFILPSKIEPWGVVVHEAAAAGLPIICSDASGAAVHLVREGYNGFIFEPDNVQQLARYLLEIEQTNSADLRKMGHGSFELSKQFTPELWADTLINGLHRLS